MDKFCKPSAYKNINTSTYKKISNTNTNTNNTKFYNIINKYNFMKNLF